MSKVIIFSRTFPDYHPKAGEPTYFVEKFWNSIYIGKDREDALFSHELAGIWSGWCEVRDSIGAKHHTIRAGSRFKVGDKFSPRVWSGKPYKSKQTIIAPDIEIKKVWSFEMDLCAIYSINGKYITEQQEYDLATNDGLTEMDMQFWFIPNIDKPKPFTGQIICWNEKIEY